MKKTLVKSLALAFVGSLLVAGSALALPNNADYWAFNDQDNYNSNSFAAAGFTYAELMNVFTYFSAGGEFGIYSVDNLYNITGHMAILNSTIGSTVQVDFNDTLTPGSVLVEIDTPTTVFDGGEFSYLSSTGFGFYFTNDAGSLVYTDQSLNGGVELITIDYAPDTATITYDARSIVVKTDDVAPVPEPATMLLLGTGLVGLAGARRRMAKKQ